MTDPKESKDSSAEKFCHKTEIEIPFENERYARIVCNCLMVDFKHEPPRIAVSIKKNIDQIDGKLSVKLETSSLKSLRVNVNSILEHIVLLIETIDHFDFKESNG